MQRALPPLHTAPRKSWVQEATWALIQQSRTANQQNNQDLAAALNKTIKTSARADSKQWILEGTGSQDHVKERWKAVRNIKRDFTPDYYARTTQNGEPIPSHEKATTTARHLAEHQWDTTQIAKATRRPAPTGSQTSPSS